MINLMPFLIPLAAIMIPIVGTIVHFLGRDNELRRRHETVRLAIEKGQAIPTQFLEKELVEAKVDPDKCHLRLLTAGLVNIGVGAGLWLGLSHVPGAAFAAWFGTIPVFIGVALFLAAFIGRGTRRNDEKGDDTGRT